MATYALNVNNILARFSCPALNALNVNNILAIFNCQGRHLSRPGSSWGCGLAGSFQLTILCGFPVNWNGAGRFLQGSWLCVHIAASRSLKSLLHVFAISAHALLCRRYSQNYSTSGTPEHSLNLKKQSVMPWISVRQTVRLKSAKILISPVKHNLLCEWSAKVLWLCRRATGGCGGGEWPLYWGHGEPDPGGSSCGRDGAIPADPATLLQLTSRLTTTAGEGMNYFINFNMFDCQMTAISVPQLGSTPNWTYSTL